MGFRSHGVVPVDERDQDDVELRLAIKYGKLTGAHDHSRAYIERLQTRVERRVGGAIDWSCFKGFSRYDRKVGYQSIGDYNMMYDAARYDEETTHVMRVVGYATDYMETREALVARLRAAPQRLQEIQEGNVAKGAGKVAKGNGNVAKGRRRAVAFSTKILMVNDWQ